MNFGRKAAERWVQEKLESVLTGMSNWLFPPRQGCLLCGAAPGRSGNGALCPKCWAALPGAADLGYCPVCGRFLAELRGEGAGPCPECRERPPVFSKARSCGPYGGLLKETLYRYKYRGQRDLAGPLGLMMAQTFVDEPGFADMEALIPVPLHEERLLMRGFNQAELLARRMSRVLGLPVPQGLIRHRATDRQSRLTRDERQENLQGAFQFLGHIRYKRVILVDDVLTTGATANECALVLRQAGFETVGVMTLASVVLEKGLC